LVYYGYRKDPPSPPPPLSLAIPPLVSASFDPTVLYNSTNAKRSPTVYLRIGPGPDPTVLAIPQTLLTRNSQLLHQHLRSQVLDEHKYATRDKVMSLRHETPETVKNFKSWCEKGCYDGALRDHVLLEVFANKYEVRELATHARWRASVELKRIVTQCKALGNEKSLWEGVYGGVLKGVGVEERGAVKETLKRLVKIVGWENSGHHWN
jgi:hypothetical protein